MWEQSDVVLTFASQAAESACSKPLQSGPLPASTAEQLCVLLFDVHAARYTTAVKLNQQVGCHGGCKDLSSCVFMCCITALGKDTCKISCRHHTQTWHVEQGQCNVPCCSLCPSDIEHLACVNCPNPHKFLNTRPTQVHVNIRTLRAAACARLYVYAVRCHAGPDCSSCCC